MGYFKAQLGKRPSDPPEPDAQPAPIDMEKKETALFGSQLGPSPSASSGDTDLQPRVRTEQRLVKPGQSGVSPSALSEHPSGAGPIYPTHCPLCRGQLIKEHGIYQCDGRCRARWLEESPGHLVDLAALPFGVCVCCGQPQVLVRSERGAACPVSGSEYLLLPGGPQLLADAAPNGLCLCCAPPAPLIRRDGMLICQARPANRYRREQGQVFVESSAPAGASSAEALAAIDQALRCNSARLTVNGLFDLE